MNIDELCYYLCKEMSTKIFYPFNFKGLQINLHLSGDMQECNVMRRRMGNHCEIDKSKGTLDGNSSMQGKPEIENYREFDTAVTERFRRIGHR